MKITITNAYTWYNKGDAGILLGIVEVLKKIYTKDLSIEVLSFTPGEDKKRYCKDLHIKNVYSNVLNPHPYKHTKFGKSIAIIKLIFSLIYQYTMINLNPKKLIKRNNNYQSLAESDLIIVCGGGFLGGKKFDSLMHLFQIYVDTKMNKRVIMMGTSIEPISSKFIKKMTEKILKRVDYVFARETITYDYLSTFLPTNKYELIPDMAFMLEGDNKKQFKVKEMKEKYDVIYGITVRNWEFPGFKNGKELFENYKKVLSQFIEKKANENNALFVFVPQVIVSYSSDAKVAKEIRNMISKKYQKNFIILEDDLHPEEIKKLISNFDYFIGTRMHSNIFATSMSIPTVAIAYEKKTNGIMNMVDLSEYILEMDKITLEEMIKLTTKQEKEYDKIKKKLNKRIKEIRYEIIKKSTLVLEDK